VLLVADLLFRELDILSGRSPNLKRWKREAQPVTGKQQFQTCFPKRRENARKSRVPYLIWLDANGKMLWGSWELRALLLLVYWFSVPVSKPKRT